jgi:hypothetical protein
MKNNKLISLLCGFISLTACNSGGSGSRQGSNSNTVVGNDAFFGNILLENVNNPNVITNNLEEVPAIGFTDKLNIIDNGITNNSGAEYLKGMGQFMQNTVVYPTGNGGLNKPDIVANREALFLYTPISKVGNLEIIIANDKLPDLRINMTPPKKILPSNQISNKHSKVKYSTLAWTAVIPWNYVSNGLKITVVNLDASNIRQEARFNKFDFAPAAEVVLQNIRIGMLTDPHPASDNNFEMDDVAKAEYFQTIPAAKLIVGDYSPVRLSKVVLPDGTSYTNQSTQNGGVHSGDMREYIAKTLIAKGIDNANYAVTTTNSGSETSPYLFNLHTVSMVKGKYANGIIIQGMSGGAGMVMLTNTLGNELSHELGHSYGLGHYPGDSEKLDSHSNSSGWQYNSFTNILIAPIKWKAEANYSQESYVFMWDAMAGGEPSNSGALYTQHTPYSIRLIQNNFKKYNRIYADGYRFWNSQTQKYQALIDNTKPIPRGEAESVITLLAYYDPESKLPSYIYPPLYGSYGYTYDSVLKSGGNESDICNLKVEYKDRTIDYIKLENARNQKNVMNQMQVNLPRSKNPIKAVLSCNDTTLTDITIPEVSPTDEPNSAVIIGESYGYSQIEPTLTKIDLKIENNQSYKIRTRISNDAHQGVGFVTLDPKYGPVSIYPKLRGSYSKLTVPVTNELGKMYFIKLRGQRSNYIYWHEMNSTIMEPDSIYSDLQLEYNPMDNLDLPPGYYSGELELLSKYDDNKEHSKILAKINLKKSL